MRVQLNFKNKDGVRVRSAKNGHCSGLFSARYLIIAAMMSPLCALFASTQSSAATVEFSANVTPPNACTIVVQRDGLFGVSADQQILSSKLPGGQSGIADVYSSANYSLTAETTGLFTTSPSGGNLNTTFEARFSGVDIFRGRTFSERNGSFQVNLRGGTSITRANVHLIATRTGSAFPGGDYVANVTLRCE
jgi:hypothetical protein